jgi:hypothetical protein
VIYLVMKLDSQVIFSIYSYSFNLSFSILSIVPYNCYTCNSTGVSYHASFLVYICKLSVLAYCSLSTKQNDKKNRILHNAASSASLYLREANCANAFARRRIILFQERVSYYWRFSLSINILYTSHHITQQQQQQIYETAIKHDVYFVCCIVATINKGVNIYVVRDVFVIITA